MGNKLLTFPSETDLVTAAQHEYDFLQFVNSKPALYSKPVLQNALFRYETYWLPLIAQKDNHFLPAPIDIEWIWHCHLLSPLGYQSDCIAIVGKVIDHRPVFLNMNNTRKESWELWNSKYPEIPYDVDTMTSNPTLLNSEYQQKSSYDIVSAAQRQRVFNYNSSLPHFRDVKFLKRALKRYKIMLTIKRDHPSTHIVPCYDNDLIWHTHQLHPLLYQEDTKSVLGKVLNHDDSMNDRSPDAELETRSNATRKLWSDNGHKFGVPGAMYRGDPPLIMSDSNANQFAFYQIDQMDYIFSINDVTKIPLKASHLKEVLHNIHLMAPYSIYQESAPCEYSDHNLWTGCGSKGALTLRVVHSQSPTLSAAEILDSYNNVVATSHNIGTFTLPSKKQIANKWICYTHNAKTERSFLVRGQQGDYAIIKASWFGFKKSSRKVRGQAGHLVATMLVLNGRDSYWVKITATDTTSFQWKLQSTVGNCNVKEGSISLSRNVTNIAENLCIGATLSLAFVLCQPRPPPPKHLISGKIIPYLATDAKRSSILLVDHMRLLVAAGLYSSMLPRWYHTYCYGGYFYQIHPYFFSFNHYGGECSASDFGYDYDRSRNTAFDVTDDWFDSGFESVGDDSGGSAGELTSVAYTAYIRDIYGGGGRTASSGRCWCVSNGSVVASGHGRDVRGSKCGCGVCRDCGSAYGDNESADGGGCGECGG